MTRVVIVGATGYSGGELCALLSRHPRVELCALQGSAGRRSPAAFSSLHPSLRGKTGPDCEPFSLARLLAAKPDVALLATPNETSAELAAPLVEAGVRVIDLSGAYRFSDAELFAKWYGFAHPRPKLLSLATYSVPELLDASQKAALRAARIIANPGCYATSVILALRPLAHLVHATEATVADCKSGVSGAGKRSEVAYSFTELAGNFKAYTTTGHRHEPEIRGALGMDAARPFVFVPHLLPIPRGIFSTIHVPLATVCDEAALADAYARAYGSAPLVGVRAHGELPELADVVGTPRCELGFQLSPGGRRALVVSTLDNLLKGAASQAVQNLNLACGFGETDGL